MLFTTHVLAGALLGRLAGRPPLALPLGVASHFAMDTLPHWGSRGNFLPVARRDGLLALAVGATLVAAAAPGNRGAVVAGIAGAGLPDMDKPMRHFLGRSYFPEPVDETHGKIQQGVEARSRWPVDVSVGLACAAAYALLLRRRGRL